VLQCQSTPCQSAQRHSVQCDSLPCNSEHILRGQHRLRRLVTAAITSVAMAGMLSQAATAAAAAAPTPGRADRVSVTLSANVITMVGEVRATVRVNPDDDNRVLHIVLDGPMYYASTDVQLDGASAARTRDMWWQSLPPGEYTVTATVDDAKGRRLYDRKQLTVVGFTNESEP
jgi:hypothetical protein